MVPLTTENILSPHGSLNHETLSTCHQPITTTQIKHLTLSELRNNTLLRRATKKKGSNTTLVTGESWDFPLLNQKTEKNGKMDCWRAGDSIKGRFKPSGHLASSSSPPPRRRKVGNQPESFHFIHVSSSPNKLWSWAIFHLTHTSFQTDWHTLLPLCYSHLDEDGFSEAAFNSWMHPPASKFLHPLHPSCRTNKYWPFYGTLLYSVMQEMKR